MNEHQKMKIKFRKSKEIKVKQKGPQREQRQERQEKKGQSGEKDREIGKNMEGPEGHEQE